MNKPICSTGLRWLWLAVVVVILDISSKQWVMAHFALYESVPLIPFFNLTYAQNLAQHLASWRIKVVGSVGSLPVLR